MARRPQRKASGGPIGGPDSNELPADRRVPSPMDSPEGGDKSGSGGQVLGNYAMIDGGDGQEDYNWLDVEGGSYVTIGKDQESTPPDKEFYGNLADGILPEVIMETISLDLMRKVEDDKEGRKKRDEQYEEGLRRTGLGKDAPGGARFEGASKVVHPMMVEACIDYESRIIKEIMPPSGPVKKKIVGVATAEKVARAERVVEHMNYQITTQIQEARSVLEVTLTQVPLGGSQFIKQFWDHRLHRPRWEFVPIDKIYLPFSAADFASSHRRTFVDTITEVEFKQRVEQKIYRDLSLAAPSQVPEGTKAEKANEKIEGKEDPGMNLDGQREIYEVMAFLEVTEEMADVLEHEEVGKLYPYLVSIDVTSRKVLSFYRDWEDGDDTRKPVEHLFEFPFIPWRGGYSIGLPQIIGGLSAAATGALRALLDSAHISNAAGGFILKGSGASGQSKSPEIGTFMEIDGGGLEADDIRKRIMQFSVTQPSTVLFQLLGMLVDAAKGTVRTSLDETPADSNANVPVGTQMARVQEGMVVFSAIHGRAHAALNRLLAGLYRLNRLYLPEMIRVDNDGKELLVRRKDYDGAPSIQPVSDPTIYSDQQRFAQLNYIQSRMQVNPTIWKVREVELAGLKLINWPDPESLLQAAPEPAELNATNENLSLALGKPAIAFPEQDHLAHLQTHLDFMKSPMLGMNPLIAPKFIPLALQHIVEHIVYFYVQDTVDVVEHAAGRHIGDLFSNDYRLKKSMDQLLAMASQHVIPQVEQAVAGAMPILQQAMALMKSMAPPPPMDPAVAAVQAAAAETQRKGIDDKTTAALTAQKQQTDAQLQQQKNAIDAQRVQAMLTNAQLAAQTKIQTTDADNETASEISSARIASGAGGAGFKDGQSLTGS